MRNKKSFPNTASNNTKRYICSHSVYKNPIENYQTAISDIMPGGKHVEGNIKHKKQFASPVGLVNLGLANKE